MLFGFLLRSTRAADTFPECLRAVALTTTAPPPTTAPTTDPVGSGVDGKSAALPLRLRVLGLQLVHRVCESASSANIATHGGTLLHSVVLKLLEDPTLPDELQTLAYSAIGKLSRRCPDLFHDNFDLLEQLFRKSTPGSTGASSSTPVCVLHHTNWVMNAVVLVPLILMYNVMLAWSITHIDDGLCLKGTWCC